MGEIVKEEVHEGVLEYIQYGIPDEEYFEELYLELFQVQKAENPVYNRWLRMSGAENPTTWQEVLPMPVNMFKSGQGLISGSMGDLDRVWESSGTTTGKPSLTPLLSTDFYDATIHRASLRWLPFSNSSITIALVPSSQQWPWSSLAYMFSKMEELESKSADAVYAWKRPLTVDDKRFTLDFEATTAYLETAIRENIPVRLLGTSYAFLQLFDYLKEKGLRYQLPSASSIVDTGGYKGITRSISRAEFLDYCEGLLGLDPWFCINEYGMSEMSSQLWTPVAHKGKDGEDEWWDVPHWVRVQILNPVTREPDPNGVAVFYDLANVWSVATLQTEDLGAIRQRHQGVQHVTQFKPLGRAQGAVAKGCSITAELAMKVE